MSIVYVANILVMRCGQRQQKKMWDKLWLFFLDFLFLFIMMFRRRDQRGRERKKEREKESLYGEKTTCAASVTALETGVNE